MAEMTGVIRLLKPTVRIFKVEGPLCAKGPPLTVEARLGAFILVLRALRLPAAAKHPVACSGSDVA